MRLGRSVASDILSEFLTQDTSIAGNSLRVGSRTPAQIRGQQSILVDL